MFKLFIHILTDVANLPCDLQGKKYIREHHLTFNTENIGNLPIIKCTTRPLQ